MGVQDEIQQRRSWGILVAKTAPKSWVEAASGLLDEMESFERGKLSGVTALNSHEVRRKVRALRKLGEIVDAGVKVMPPRLLGADPETDEGRAIALASVLCPAGWRNKILPIFVKAKLEAEDNFIQSDLDEDFELRSALEQFINTLYQVENDGQVARSKQLQAVVNG